MGELVFVGLGLHDEKGISMAGFEEARRADYIFVESYTGLMPGLRTDTLQEFLQRKVIPVSRRMLEEDDGEEVLDAVSRGKTVLLVPGDPMIATTHVNLRIRAHNMGVRTRIIHGASIISAVMGLSGLQNYKFGKSVSIPFAGDGHVAETPYGVVKANLEAGLHTLCFLDMDAERKRYMTIREGLEALLLAEKKLGDLVLGADTLVVGVARAGSRNCVVKSDTLERLARYDFKGPPHTIVFPGKLHFIEAEALIKLADAPESIRERAK